MALSKEDQWLRNLGVDQKSLAAQSGGGATPLSSQKIDVTFRNSNGSTDAYYTILDMNLRGKLIFEDRLNAGESTALTLQADGSNQGEIKWHAADAKSPTTGRDGEAKGIKDGAKIDSGFL